LIARGPSGGTISVMNRGSGGINLESADYVNASGQEGNGGGISLAAQDDRDSTSPTHRGTLTIGGGTLRANANSTNNQAFNGGSINLEAKSLNLTGNVLLDAHATQTDTGSAGSQSFIQVTTHGTGTDG